MIKEAIVKIVNKEDLTYDEAYARHERNYERQNDSYTECRFSCRTFHQECKS